MHQEPGRMYRTGFYDSQVATACGVSSEEDGYITSLRIGDACSACWDMAALKDFLAEMILSDGVACRMERCGDEQGRGDTVGSARWCIILSMMIPIAGNRHGKTRPSTCLGAKTD